MSAADILDRLLDELESVCDPGEHSRENCPGDSCYACHFRRLIRGMSDDARLERDRARLIFGEAA